MAAVLERSRGRRGPARWRLLAALRENDVGRTGTHSQLEEAFPKPFYEAGVEPPRMGVWLDVPGGPPILVDAHVAALGKVVVEIDSEEVHGRPRTQRLDRLKQARLEAAGYEVIRCGPAIEDVQACAWELVARVQVNAMAPGIRV